MNGNSEQEESRKEKFEEIYDALADHVLDSLKQKKSIGLDIPTAIDKIIELRKMFAKSFG
ncbi:MAG TPA: hypothetical protein VF941_00205 [Clostridia bacterium]